MLNLDELMAVLHRVVTGLPSAAIEYLEGLADLAPEDRAALVGALSITGDGAVNARSLGDCLRGRAADRDLVNECYRAAFYASPEPQRLADNPLFAAFLARKGGLALDKWPHYFDVYHRYLARYRGSAVRVLEIGVYRGGGLDLLRGYLGQGAVLVGLDIDPVAAEVAGDRHVIVLGDQTDPDLLARVVAEHGPFDVVIDDGGHTMDQQVTTAEILLPLMPDGSTYIVEDTHTSYWSEYDGGLRASGSFMEWTKDRLDDVNAYHWSEETPPTRFADRVSGIHVHDSIVVIDVGRAFPPFAELAGNWDFLNSSRPAASIHSQLLATLEAVRHESAIAAQTVEQTNAELERTRQERDDLVDSYSWRITRPLRTLKQRAERRRAGAPEAPST